LHDAKLTPEEREAKLAAEKDAAPGSEDALRAAKELEEKAHHIRPGQQVLGYQGRRLRAPNDELGSQSDDEEAERKEEKAEQFKRKLSGRLSLTGSFVPLGMIQAKSEDEVWEAELVARMSELQSSGWVEGNAGEGILSAGLVGSSVKVFWNEEHKFVDGTIIQWLYDGVYMVDYAHLGEQAEDLSDENWMRNISSEDRAVVEHSAHAVRRKSNSRRDSKIYTMEWVIEKCLVGQQLVGRKIKVFWVDDQAFMGGFVEEFTAPSTYLIKYDDDEPTVEDLSEEVWLLETRGRWADPAMALRDQGGKDMVGRHIKLETPEGIAPVGQLTGYLPAKSLVGATGATYEITYNDGQVAEVDLDKEPCQIWENPSVVVLC